MVKDQRLTHMLRDEFCYHFSTMAKQRSSLTQYVAKRYLYQVSFGPPTFTDFPPMITSIQSFQCDVPRGPWPFTEDSPRVDGTAVLQLVSLKELFRHH